MSEVKNLSEAAAEILKANLASKKGMPAEKLDGKSSEIGNAGLEQYSLSDVPTATPPGQTPPVSAEPIKKLKDQPAQKAPLADAEVEQLPKKGVNEEQKDEDEDEDESCNEDIQALMAGENLSEDFKKKATAIFEAAVKAKVLELSEQLEQKYVEQFNEAYEEMKEDFATKVDDYLDYVVESWMTENKVAVESGLKTEIVESFIGSLKSVFEEHYIDIPEDKVNVVEELASKVEALETQINEEMAKNIDLKKQLSEQRKVEAVNTVCEGLTLSQQEKIKTIAESVEFTSEEEFKTQLETIKESYFQKETVKPASKESLEDVVTINEEKETTKAIDPIIAQYAKRITQTTFK